MTQLHGKRTTVNRRAFLRGVGTVAIGLPFLEGLPERSAWGADAPPVFSFFIVAANGVVQDRFWPTAAGALTPATMGGKGVEPLAAYAQNLLMVKGIKAPGGSSANCGHAQGYVQALTGAPPASGGNSSTSGGPSADYVISQALNPAGTDPLTLYSGTQRGAYIAERTSFSAASTAARSAQLNPYETYKKLMNLTPATPAPSGSSPTTGPSPADDLLLRQKSVNDLVRDEFASLIARPELSAEDKARLTNHMEGIRKLELDMVSTGDMITDVNDGTGATGAMVAAGCSTDNIDVGGITAFTNGVKFNPNSHMIEDLVKLHGETVALAFACNANRTATLQWGDGTDGTVYTTQAKGGYNTFHKISHRTNSDASAGNDTWAKDAHSEIDIIRMETFAHVLQVFQAYGLFENSFIYWTNSISDGPSHAFSPLPVIIAGSGGGFLKQGQYVEVQSTSNSAILASLITAAGLPTEKFGNGNGQLTQIHA